ncbi:MAG: DCC1-like thiol-disulfide oxidoreductase family protein [Chitinophagales bacterium]|nr:DCC1-like thiol-disulfide oxidoreductase family protein [Chitinophagales bacterium]
MKNEKIENPIIIFDGVCNYCNKWINFSIKWNKKRNLRYTVMQGETGKILKNHYKIDNTIDSVVFIDKNKAYINSSAVINIAKHLQFPICLLYFLIIVPPFFRDKVYRWIAKNRYKWFGKKDSCMIPSKEIKQLFIE